MKWYKILESIVVSKKFSHLITFAVVLNAITISINTYLPENHPTAILCNKADKFFLWFFIIESLLKMAYHKKKFFKNPWYNFDLIIVASSSLSSYSFFSVLRAFRIIRVLMVISLFPKLRRVINGLFTAIPSITYITFILCLVSYIFAVIGTQLFGDTHPDNFGTIQISLFSLLKVATLDGWSDLAMEVMKVHPLAWMYFFIYVVLISFAILNLFIAVIIDSMQTQKEDEQEEMMEEMMKEMLEEKLKEKKLKNKP